MRTRLIVALLVLSSLLLSCSTVPHSARPVTAPTRAQQLPERPEETLAAINRRYNLVDNQCREAVTNELRGHYYCSGVLMRDVANGSFLPWAYSDAEMARGSSSWSWTRRDMVANVQRSFTAAGFILRNPVEGMASGLPALDQGLICLYPLEDDASDNHRHKGCALKSESTVLYPQPEARHRNQAYAWGQCEGMGIRSIPAWLALWERDPQLPPWVRPQCSWNADSPEGWSAAISLFNTLQNQYGDEVYPWNKLLLDNRGDDGTMLMPYIAAFYYDPFRRCDSLFDAQTFQRRLADSGYWVPVLRMDPRAAPEQRFSYRPEDQLLLPMEVRDTAQRNSDRPHAQVALPQGGGEMAGCRSGDQPPRDISARAPGQRRLS